MWRSSARSCGLALLAAVISGSDLAAQEQKTTSFAVHGYLTQAYGLSSRDLVMGLTKDGTADYRRAAVLARYSVSSNNHFVAQLGHRRLGESPTMEFEDDLKVDMAFYEHRFRNDTRLRVGKVLMPFGIYNEVRYAGTLIPFYRAPISVYWEGTYTSETIDGLVASHRFRSGEPWEVAVDLFGGSYSLLEFRTVRTSPTTAVYAGARVNAKNAVGAQLWITTPLDGLRFGVNTRRHTDLGGVIARGTGSDTWEWSPSLDASFERWQFRSEAMWIKSDLDVKVQSKYAQLSFRPVERLSLNAQAEFSDVDSKSPLTGPLPVEIQLVRDQALGVGFLINPKTVFKLEAHQTRGFNVEQVANVVGTPLRGSYFIGSFSVSF